MSYVRDVRLIHKKDGMLCVYVYTCAGYFKGAFKFISKFHKLLLKHHSVGLCVF